MFACLLVTAPLWPVGDVCLFAVFVWSTVSRDYKSVCMYLTAAHNLFCIIVSGSGLINTVMERGGFSGDFLVTFALSSRYSFSAGVCPDVLSSGCVERLVYRHLFGRCNNILMLCSCTLKGHASLMDSLWPDTYAALLKAWQYTHVM